MNTQDFLAGVGFLACFFLLALLMLTALPDGHAEVTLVMPTEVKQ